MAFFIMVSKPHPSASFSCRFSRPVCQTCRTRCPASCTLGTSARCMQRAPPMVSSALSGMPTMTGHHCVCVSVCVCMLCALFCTVKWAVCVMRKSHLKCRLLPPHRELDFVKVKAAAVRTSINCCLLPPFVCVCVFHGKSTLTKYQLLWIYVCVTATEWSCGNGEVLKVLPWSWSGCRFW